MLPNLDVRILLEFNALVPADKAKLELFDLIGRNPLIRGLPLVFPFMVVWLAGQEEPKRHARMLMGLLAVFAATLLTVQMQHYIPLHVRPILDPSLPLQHLQLSDAQLWDRKYSFPSDTATLFFALATVVFLENRLLGTIGLVWTLLYVGFFRVATGWHYPSDILGSLVVGPCFVLLLEKPRQLVSLAERCLERWKNYPNAITAAVFVSLADAYSLFSGLGDIYSRLSHMAKALLH